MKNNGKVSFWYSWPVIVIALCLFWPIGIYLIIKRVSFDRKAAMGAGVIINIFGIVSYCFAALGLLVCISEGFDGMDVALILFFGAAGFALTKVAKKIKNEAKKVKEYLSIIINGNVHQLDVIASTTGKSYDVVYKDVKKMIDKGYLKNAYINEEIREIVIPGVSFVPQYNASTVNANAVAQIEPRVVACPCCGANNTVYSDVGECEYCGSPLK